MKQTFIHTLLPKLFPPKDSVFYCLLSSLSGGHQREKFWNLGLWITGKYISDTFCCTSMINMIFFPLILWFGDKYTKNCITQAGHYGTGYYRNELCVYCQRTWFKQLLKTSTRPQGWSETYLRLLPPDCE